MFHDPYRAKSAVGKRSVDDGKGERPNSTSDSRRSSSAVVQKRKSDIVHVDNFDWREYLIANVDLIDGGIDTKDLATKHWLETGKNQRREVKSKTFDWTRYIAINQDLIDHGHITKDAAQEHYIHNGYKEGRRTILVGFEWEFYIVYNNHLIQTGINTQSKAIKHWIEYGKREGLITTIDPIREQYNKMVSFDYTHIYNIFNISDQTQTYVSSSSSDAMLLQEDMYQIANRNTPMFKQLDIISNIHTKMEDYTKFILIVDFPCYGGGCSFFINSIISQFRFNTHFLIVRCFKEKIHWYIDDLCIFQNSMDLQGANRFLDTYVDKIEKIFVNSTVGHSSEFIEKLFTLNKEVTTLLHDFTLLFNNPQLYFHEISDDKVNYKFNIHRFNRIITQHIGNLYSFGRYLQDYNNIVVSELPDYRKSDKKIIANTAKTVIAIIGDISDVKGYYALYHIYSMIELRKDVELVVFGKAHIQNLTKQYSYQTIEDFNYLLETHKPNILLELSLWPETFSFTLTLAMITKLPIIYHTKFLPNTVQRRISLYQNAYSFDDVHKLSLDWIIKRKQNYLYTIKPCIYFPPFWKTYFCGEPTQSSIISNIFSDKVNVVIVTSKIYVSSTPFSYIAKRSIYTKEERYNQTFDTISSIRKYIPNSFILLFDNSHFTNEEYQEIKTVVDCFINIQNDEVVNKMTNNSIHKVFGEISQTYKMISYIQTYYKDIKIHNLFKITGRYIIDDRFDYKQYDNDKSIFKRNDDITDRSYYFTCFYKIGKPGLDFFYEALAEIYQDIQHNCYEYEEWEVLLPTLLHKRFITTNELGVTQNIAVWTDKSQI